MLAHISMLLWPSGIACRVPCRCQGFDSLLSLLESFRQFFIHSLHSWSSLEKLENTFRFWPMFHLEKVQEEHGFGIALFSTLL